MQKFRGRPISILLLSIALSFPLSAYPASLKSTLDSMFVSNATPSSVFSNANRTGADFGSLYIRAPIRSVNLIAFDPPRLSAGCGGVDLFGGSFSFINSDQLVALFRQVAANAVGLAFKAAINAINPQLGLLMEQFQQKIAALNQMMKNSCSIANQLTKTMMDPDARANMVQDASNMWASARGSVGDLFEATSKTFTNTLSFAWDSLDSRNPDSGTLPNVGNLTWRAIVHSKAAQNIGVNGGAALDESFGNRLVMSLLGTVVTAQNPDESQGETNSAGGVENKDQGLTYAHTIDLKDIRDGDPDKKIYTCKDSGGSSPSGNECTVLSQQYLGPGKNGISGSGWIGVEGYVKEMLFGSVTYDTSEEPSVSSIIGKITSCSGSGCSMTASQARFLGSISPSLVKNIRAVQGNNGAVRSIAYQMIPLISTDIMDKLSGAILVATDQSYSQTKVTIPETVLTRQAELRTQRAEILSDARDQITKYNQIRTQVEFIIRDKPAVVASVGAR